MERANTSHKVEQFRIGTEGNGICGLIRCPEDDVSHNGILFCPGFAQSKAGSYFLFSRIAQLVSHQVCTLQFDYRGWGDSDGQPSDTRLSTLLADAHLTREFQVQHCHLERLTLVGSGVGNFIAVTLGDSHPPSPLVLVCPKPRLLSDPRFEPFVRHLHESPMVDTSAMGDWSNDANLRLLFESLGECLYRAKGLLVSSTLVLELMACDVGAKAQQYSGPILEVQHERSRFLTSTDNADHFRVSDGGPLLLDARSRQLAIGNIAKWLLKTTRGL